MKLVDILNDSEAAIGQARGMLAKLYRIVLRDLNVNIYDFERYMSSWLDNPINNIPKYGKERSSERGNVIKEVERENMTWRVFIKHIRFMKIKHMHIQISLTGADDKVTVHNYGVKVSNVNEDIEALADTIPPMTYNPYQLNFRDTVLNKSTTTTTTTVERLCA